jgi:CelD/BcsL family acetyltransferase involved in cellulose biosynthesis
VPPLQLEELGSVDALERLVPEWDALVAATPSASPFLSAGWVLPWWHHLGAVSGSAALAGRPTIRCVAVRRDGALVGLAPWMAVRVGIGPTSLEVLVGIGQETADLGGVLVGGVDPDGPAAVAQALAGHLAPALRTGRTVLAAARLVDDDPWLLALRSLAPQVQVEAIAAEVHPRLDLSDMEDPVRAVARLMKRNDVRRRWRRLEEAEGARFRYLQDDPVEALAAFRQLHELRWETKDGDPDWLYRTSLGWRFLADASMALHQRDLLRISLVETADGRPVAARFGFEHGGTYYGAKSGWDPAFAAHGPGHLVLGRVVEHAAAAGLGTVDLMRGDEPHKRAWATSAPVVRWWVAARNGAIGRAAVIGARGALSLRHRRARAIL